MSKNLWKVLGRTALLCCTPSIAGAQTVIFQDDFESGPGLWTMTADWHLTPYDFGGCSVVPPPARGPVVARFGKPGACFFNTAAGRMTNLTPIDIPATAQAARLRFESFESTECGWSGGGNCGWDHRSIYVSKDQGLSWTLVWEGGGEGKWIEKSVDLSAWLGESVSIAFEFDPIDNVWNAFDGWLVEDVRVEIDPPGSPTIYCTPKLNSLGCYPLMSYAGDGSLSGPDDLTLAATNLRNNVWGSFAWNLAPASQPFFNGTLCVQAPATRTPVASSAGTPGPTLDCSGSYVWTFTHDYLTAQQVQAGQTLYVQFFARDFGFGFAPITLSNAVAVPITP